MKNLELTIPAPILAAISMVLMYLTSLALPLAGLSTQTRCIIAVASLVIGGGIALAGIVQFRLTKTTVQPNPNKTTALVTDGIYRYTRNPMYVGLVIGLVGFAGFLNSAFALVWIIGFIGVLMKIQIIPEEKALIKKFPEEYQQYKQSVRRWI